MKRSRFSEEQIIGSSRSCGSRKRGRRRPMCASKHGVSGATFYKWKAQYGRMDVSGRGRKKMVTPAARREAAAHLRQVHGVSQRRACQAIGVDHSSVCYRSRRPDDGRIRSRRREIAAIRRRFGYRRLPEQFRLRKRKVDERKASYDCRGADRGSAAGGWRSGAALLDADDAVLATIHGVVGVVLPQQNELFPHPHHPSEYQGIFGCPTAAAGRGARRAGLAPGGIPTH
jgi:hypothetical protein